LLKSNWLHVVIVLIITLLTFINIYQNNIVWDDHDFIERWDTPKDAKNIGRLLAGDTPDGHQGVYRPLRGVLYIFYNWLFGENAAGYHTLALFVHLSCTLLIYLIAKKLSSNHWLALMASALFGVHPIHTESITYIAAAVDMLAVVFMLASFYLYLLAVSSGRLRLYIISILLSACAFFIYELTLSLPLLILFYEVCFEKRKAMVRSIPYFAVLGIFLFLRSTASSMGARGGYIAGSFYLTMLVTSKAILKYLLLLFFPLRLSIDHELSKGILSYKKEITSAAALSQNILEIEVIAAVVIMLGLLYIAYKNHKKSPLITFSIGWFFIALAPVSNIIPGATLMAERYAYIPSVGFCIGIAILFSALHKSLKGKPAKKALISIFILMTLLFAARTVARNSDWRSDESIWKSATIVTPESCMSHLNLGAAYYEEGEIDKALSEYMLSIVANPEFADPYNNLGNVYMDKGDPKSAEEYYKKALTLNPLFAKAHYNLAYLYHTSGQLDLAKAGYEKTIELRPDLAEAYNNLGLIYRARKEFDKAIAMHKRAIYLSPRYADAYTNLGAAYKSEGDIDSAIMNYQKAISIDSVSYQAYFNLGIAYRDKGDTDLAKAAFQKALAIEPSLTQAKDNLDALI